MAKIETSQTYEKGRPKLGGLSDPRMGTMDRALKVRCSWDQLELCRPEGVVQMGSAGQPPGLLVAGVGLAGSMPHIQPAQLR